METLNLMTHTGAERVTRGEIERIATPENTDTWYPIPHHDLLTGVEESLTAAGLKIVAESHALDKKDARYFGLMQVANGENAKDYSLVVGLRNSHDKAFSAGLVVGSGVFVCDNLAFSGEIKLARKHTRFINRDLGRLIHVAVGRLGDIRHLQDKRISAYKETELQQRDAHDLMVRAMSSGVIAGSAIPKVLEEWRSPRHPEFKNGRTAWRLFNAFTEVLKASNLFDRPRRTQALHGIMDVASGLSKSRN